MVRDIERHLDRGSLDVALRLYLKLPPRRGQHALRERMRPIAREWEALRKVELPEGARALAKYHAQQALLLSARAELAQGNATRAWASYDRAAKLGPAPAVYAERGLSAWRRGHRDAARADFARARALAMPSLRVSMTSDAIQRLAPVRLASLHEDRLARVIGERRVGVWLLARPRREVGFELPADIVALRFTPAGKLVVVCRDGRIFAWTATEQQAKLLIGGLAAPISSFDLSLDGRRAVLGSASGQVMVIDLEQGERVATWAAANDPVLDVAFDPEGNVSTAGLSPPVKLWRVIDQKVLAEVQGRLGARFLAKGRGVYTCEASGEPHGRECGWSIFQNFAKGKVTHRRGCGGAFVGSRLDASGRVLWACEQTTFFCKRVDCTPNGMVKTDRATDVGFVSDDQLLVVDAAQRKILLQRLWKDSLEWREPQAGGLLLTSGDQVSGTPNTARPLLQALLSDATGSWEYPAQVVWDWAFRPTLLASFLELQL